MGLLGGSMALTVSDESFGRLSGAYRQSDLLDAAR
jgi:hypothetical protein